MWVSIEISFWCMCQVFCYVVMEMTSNLRSVAESETIQSLSLTTGPDYPLFSSPKCALCLVKPPSGTLKSQQTPGTPSLQEGFGGCEEKRQTRPRVSLGGCGMCQLKSTSQPFCRELEMTYTHKQIDFRFLRRNVRVSVLPDTLLTDKVQTDRGWSSMGKQINRPFLRQHGGLHVLIQQRQTCCEVKGDR